MSKNIHIYTDEMFKYVRNKIYIIVYFNQLI